MIRKDELAKAADSKRLSMENAEKDYFLDLLLFSIYDEFGDILVLKGGTSLYKIYNLNRFSEDLDFTLNRRRFDADKFVKKISASIRLLEIESKAVVERYRNEINIRMSLKGPLYDGSARKTFSFSAEPKTRSVFVPKESLCLISLNISLRERVAKEAKKEMIIPHYREIPSFEVFAMDQQEIFAEKIRAIFTRNKPRDVYDLWFLLKKGIKPDAGLINKKLRICRIKFSKNRLAKTMEEKREFWKGDLKGLIIGELPDFEKIKEFILTFF
ncbi:nucleotidyl transferase AbiEii/AbiGii toxin family protein [archaeon]|nr:MAG: nucleotidyl transferase AbiEii/AbiGii toxin family protein [archaeon]